MLWLVWFRVSLTGSRKIILHEYGQDIYSITFSIDDTEAHGSTRARRYSGLKIVLPMHIRAFVRNIAPGLCEPDDVHGKTQVWLDVIVCMVRLGRVCTYGGPDKLIRILGVVDRRTRARKLSTYK